MVEERQSISSSLSKVTAAEAARHTFATVRRGYDPQEVRAYLEVLARELQAAEQRDQDLRHALADAENRAKNPSIDESTLSAALGQQSAQVLRNAHIEAARITQLAEEAAATLGREAQAHAAELRVQAESGLAERIAEAELAAGTVAQQAQRQVEDILAAARAEAEGVVNEAREQGRAMVETAQETRRQVLAEMAQRRRAITLQIEQFRAARDELAAAIHGLRDSVDEAIGDLAKADDRARAAAAEVARRQPAESAEPESTGAIYDVEAEGAPGPAAGPESTDAVEGLFARLRATQPGEAADDAPGEEPEAEAGEATGEEPDPLETRGAQLLDPVVAALGRRIKRALQDDQNRLLDRLRSGPGTWSDDALVAEDEQRAHFAEAVAKSLKEAAAAGVVFAREQAGGAGGKSPAIDEQAVTRIAEGLAGAIVAPLRRKLTDAEAAGEAAERVGAAYREWRGQRVERLAGDYALEAFSLGVVTATPPGAGLRWVVGAAEGPCADCEDNALAGTVATGEAFPTGHPHPPAHAGCRCLVVPTPA
jgi:DivIVA domain-containing protein